MTFLKERGSLRNMLSMVKREGLTVVRDRLRRPLISCFYRPRLKATGTIAARLALRAVAIDKSASESGSGEKRLLPS